MKVPDNFLHSIFHFWVSSISGYNAQKILYIYTVMYSAHIVYCTVEAVDFINVHRLKSGIQAAAIVNPKTNLLWRDSVTRFSTYFLVIKLPTYLVKFSQKYSQTLCRCCGWLRGFYVNVANHYADTNCQILLRIIKNLRQKLKFLYLNTCISKMRVCLVVDYADMVKATTTLATLYPYHFAHPVSSLTFNLTTL